MGNKTSGFHSPPRLELKLLSSSPCPTATTGDKVMSCLYGQWRSGKKLPPGFKDGTDYSTARNQWYSKVSSARQDNLSGRVWELYTDAGATLPVYLVSTSWTRAVKITTRSEGGYQSHPVDLPSFEIPRAWPHGRVLATRGHVFVVQLLEGTYAMTTRGANSTMLWIGTATLPSPLYQVEVPLKNQPLDCSISPDGNRIIISVPIFNRAANIDRWTCFEVHLPSEAELLSASSTCLPVTAHRFREPIRGAGALCFHSAHPNRYFLRVHNQSLSIYDLDSHRVVVSGNIPRYTYGMAPATACQVKLSAFGQVAAIRCVQPYGHRHLKENYIVVVDGVTLAPLYRVDAFGPRLPFTEIINMQIFPKFSSCGTHVAVMKNTRGTRHINVYKLPPPHNFTLLSVCRRAIRASIPLHDIISLPIPKRFIHYLLHDHDEHVFPPPVEEEEAGQEVETQVIEAGDSVRGHLLVGVPVNRNGGNFEGSAALLRRTTGLPIPTLPVEVTISRRTRRNEDS